LVSRVGSHVYTPLELQDPTLKRIASLAWKAKTGGSIGKRACLVLLFICLRRRYPEVGQILPRDAELPHIQVVPIAPDMTSQKLNNIPNTAK